jgi:(p)ppGpp synthase/HD superfamily hydrolase
MRTGADLLAEVRPMAQWARAVHQITEIAQDAIRLEAGLALAETKLADQKAALETACGDLARVVKETETLSEKLSAERIAAETATAARCAEMIADAKEDSAKQRAVAEGWSDQARVASKKHQAKMAEWAAEESEMQAHISGLRDLAARMAKAAEAVPR